PHRRHRPRPDPHARLLPLLPCALDAHPRLLQPQNLRRGCPRLMPLSIRLATTDDADEAAHLYAQADLPNAPTTPGAFELMTQVGHAFLVAEDEHGLAGVVRFHDDEGITWFDLLVS